MWLSSCDNPQAIQRLYDSADGLERVELFEAVLQRDGPRLQLRLELPRFPDHPPARWHAEANAVQVVLDLWGAADLSIQGWESSNVGRFTLARNGDALHASFVSQGMRLRARCASARIAEVREYTSGPPEAGGDAAG